MLEAILRVLAVLAVAEDRVDASVREQELLDRLLVEHKLVQLLADAAQVLADEGIRLRTDVVNDASGMRVRNTQDMQT